MPSLRYYACDDCETVYASPGEPPECDRCAGCRFRDLTDGLGVPPYFSRPFVTDRRT